MRVLSDTTDKLEELLTEFKNLTVDGLSDEDVVKYRAKESEVE